MVDIAFSEVRINLAQHGRRQISLETLASMLGENTFKSYKRAKSGLIKLNPYVFSKIIRFLIRYNCDKNLINDIKDTFDSYNHIEKNFSNKKGNRATNYFSDLDTNSQFIKLVENSNKDIAEISSEEWEKFHNFVDFSTERLFTDSNPAECINNCHIIIKYMIINRNSIFNGVRDDIFNTRISFVARMGAWASQAIGQKFMFKKFQNYLRQALSNTNPQTVIALNMAAFHETRWNNAISKSSKSGLVDLGKAFEATKHNSLAYNENESLIILQNALSTSLHEGALFNSSIPALGDMKVEYILEKIKDINVIGSYEIGSSLHTLGIEARILINKGKETEALEAINKAWSIYKHSNISNKYYLMKLYFAEGEIYQRITKILENSSLRTAYAISIQLGAFQYSVDIAELMGWK